MAAIFLQQHIVRVVHIEMVQGCLLNTFIPKNLLKQPMSHVLLKTGFCSLGITCVNLSPFKRNVRTNNPFPTFKLFLQLTSDNQLEKGFTFVRLKL